MISQPSSLSHFVHVDNHFSKCWADKTLAPVVRSTGLRCLDDATRRDTTRHDATLAPSTLRHASADPVADIEQMGSGRVAHLSLRYLVKLHPPDLSQVKVESWNIGPKGLPAFVDSTQLVVLESYCARDHSMVHDLHDLHDRDCFSSLRRVSLPIVDWPQLHQGHRLTVSYRK